MTQPTDIRRAVVRPRLLDMFCCAGGAAVGYHRAGFEVDGCDIAPRPRYPFPYHQGDALTYLADLIATGRIGRYAVVHASRTCQAGCALTGGTNASQGWGREHVQLIPALREELTEAIPPAYTQWLGRAFLAMEGRTAA